MEVDEQVLPNIEKHDVMHGIAQLKA